MGGVSVRWVKFSVTVGAVGLGRDPRGLAELAKVVEGAGWDGTYDADDVGDYVDFDDGHVGRWD